MADDTQDSIGGTVIQRSFISSTITNVVNVASVPLSEVVDDSNQIDQSSFLPSLTAEILGIPRATIIDERQYRNLVDVLRDSDPFQLVQPRRPIHPFLWEELYYERQLRLRELMADRTSDKPIVGFGEDIVALLTGRINELDRSFYWPFVEELVRGVTAKLGNDEIDEDAVVAGLTCLAARLNRTEKVKNFTSTLMTYDIPLGQSPSTQSDSLLKLLESGKKMCLAPLVAGGTLGVGQLGQGQYVAALLWVGTGSAMTLVLLGTVAIGALLVRRVAQDRARKKS
jgi:hypothetical protein